MLEIKNSKLLQVLRSFDEKEVKNMRRLLNSPLFTTRNRLRLLFEKLVKMLKKSKDTIDPEVIHHHIFPAVSYDYGRLRGLMSDLLELIEEFWMVQTYRENRVATQLRISEIYRNRNLDKTFLSAMKKGYQLLQSQPYRNAEYYQQLLNYQTQQMKFLSVGKNTKNILLQEISDTEDILYLTKKLGTVCAQLSHQLTQKTEYDTGLLTKILDTLDQKKYLDIPAISIYYYCFKFLAEEHSDKYFQFFKNDLKLNKQLFNKDDLADPFRLAINFCIRKSNSGQVKYMSELWDLYKEGLQEDILLVHNYLPTFTFNNIISAALYIKEYDWIEKFVANEAHLLNPDNRATTLLFNLAKLAMEQKQWTKAMEHLQAADFQNARINIVGKIMLVKIYFELSEFELLHSHLDSFQQFIRRNEISDYHRQNVLNIIKYVKRIMATPEFNKKQITLLRKQIVADEILSEKEWLLAKIALL